MDIQTDNHGPSSFYLNGRRSSASYHIAPFGPLTFSNNPLFAIPPPSIATKGVLSISTTVSDFPPLFQEPRVAPLQTLGPYFPGVLVQETILPHFREW